MSPRWYYQLLMEEFGPVTPEQLLDMLQTGTLSDGDLVRLETSEDWVLLSSLHLSAIADTAASDAGATSDIADLSELAFEFEESGPSSHRSAYSADKPAPKTAAPVSAAPRSSASAPPPPAVASQTETREAPADPWYCESLGQILGPMSFEELIALGESGAIDSNDKVRCGDRGIWKTVDCLPKVMRAVSNAANIVPDAALISSTTQRRLGDAAVAQLANDNTNPSPPEPEQSLAAPPAPAEIPKPVANNSDRQSSPPPLKSKASPPRKRRGKGTRGEDELLEEIFDDVFNDENPPARAATAAGVTAAASIPIPPQPTIPPAPPSFGSSSASSARPGYPPAMPARPSSYKSARSFDVEPKTIMILVGVLLLVGAGYAIWHFGGSISMVTGSGSFDKENTVRTLNDVMARYKAIAPSPSDSDWETFTSKAKPELAELYKLVHERAGTTEDGAICLNAIRALNKIARARSDDTKLLDQCVMDYNSHIARLKQ